MTTCTTPTMPELLTRIVTHLDNGGECVVSTHLRHTVYKQKHATLFDVSPSGSLRVKHGKSKIALSMGDRLLVRITLR